MYVWGGGGGVTPIDSVVTTATDVRTSVNGQWGMVNSATNLKSQIYSSVEYTLTSYMYYLL